MTITVHDYTDLDKITEIQANENATKRVEFINGKYAGYFITVEPYYGNCLFVYDTETHRNVYYDLGLYYCKSSTEAEVEEAQYIKAQQSLFDVDVITKVPPATYHEYRKIWNFVQNIYPKRYKYISGWYIGKASGEQQKIAKKGFISFSTYNYYWKREEAEEIDKICRQTVLLHKERLNDEQYLLQALIDEFYNYECMYGGRYLESAEAVGLDFAKLTEQQKKIYNLAKCKFREQINERGFW